MNIYVARQPIFDNRMKVYGYELLYRRSQKNFFESLSDNQATAELINNAYFAMHFDKLTGGSRAFINFSEELLEREVPLLLPKENLVVEVLEHVKPTNAVVAACRKLVSHGYTLALDDYVHKEEKMPLLELATIVKLEYGSLQEPRQRNFFLQYRGRKSFIAEKLDTQHAYDLAYTLRFDFFQGYFFCKPMVITGREIPRLNANLIKIITELNRAEPDFQTISMFIRRDINMVYKLLRLANTAAHGVVQRIESIEQTLVRLGLIEFKKWVYLFILMDVQNTQSRELVKTCLVRGTLMEAIAQMGSASQAGLPHYLTGLFSSIDVVLGRPMSDIVEELLLPPEVRDALLGGQNMLRTALDNAIAFERGQWDSLSESGFFDRISMDLFIRVYSDALQWVNELA